MQVLITNEKVFKHFHKWLYERLGKNIENVNKFLSNPIPFQLIYLIEYLESNGVPFLDALVYYHYQTNIPFSTVALIRATIEQEFKRVENGITANYIPY